jgi:hypothetical protein
MRQEADEKADEEADGQDEADEEELPLFEQEAEDALRAG